MKMRFVLAVAVTLVCMGMGAWAQQGSTFKVRSVPEKEKKAAPIGKTPISATAANANARDLQNAERSSMRGSGIHSGNKKTGPALKPVKDKPNPPINFNGLSSGGKGSGMTAQGSNPYKGRLKQKGGGHQ
jgi:hypothetical protein